jgi:hypothetical protein
MNAGKCLTKLCLLSVVHALPAHCAAEVQHKPLRRVFVAKTEERYNVSVILKAQTESVLTETVASKTYVMPVTHAAEVKLRWRATRRVLSVGPDGVAGIEESFVEDQPCEEIPQPGGKSDARLLASLEHLCASLSSALTIHYAEDSKGSLHEAGAPSEPPDLGEEAPPLLALWLRRAVRPNVILPTLLFEAGARARQELHPSGDLLQDAQGSESTEWLDAQSDTPAAALHVVQQLGWDAPGRASITKGVTTHLESAPRHEGFFADSITTLSLIDGSVLRANRSASRTTRHKMETIAGLLGPPEFSSKLTTSVIIERLP